MFKRMLVPLLALAAALAATPAAASTASAPSTSAQARTAAAPCELQGSTLRWCHDNGRIYVYWGTQYVGFGELRRTSSGFHLMVCRIGVPAVQLGMQTRQRNSADWSTYFDRTVGGTCAHSPQPASTVSWRGVVAHEGGQSYTGTVSAGA